MSGRKKKDEKQTSKKKERARGCGQGFKERITILQTPRLLTNTCFQERNFSREFGNKKTMTVSGLTYLEICSDLGPEISTETRRC